MPRKTVLILSLLLLGLSPSMAVGKPRVSEETQLIREKLTPSEPAEIPDGAAMDLAPLNPNPNLLDIPTEASDVTIDISQPITLEQALILAQRNNRNIQESKLNVQLAEANLRQSQAALYPLVDIQGSLTRNQTLVDQDNTLPSGINNVDVTAEASYDVFTNGQRPASIQAEREALLATQLDLKTDLWQLQLDVANDYYDLQQANALITIAEAAVKNARDSFENTVALEQAGLGTRFDVLRAEVQLADLQQQLTQAKGQLEIARRQLAQTLSLADNANLSAADPVEEAGRWPLSLEESIVTAKKFRSELAEVVAQREIALLNQRIAKNSLGPFFSVNGSVSAGGTAFDTTGGNPFIEQFNGDLGYSVGGTATRTLFDGGASKALAQQQKINALIAETQFSNSKNVIRFQIEQNYFNMVSSLKNIGTNRQAVVQAEQSLELATLRFKEGIGTQLEVSNEENALTRSKSNLLTAIIDFNRALVGLRRSVADPDLKLASINP